MNKKALLILLCLIVVGGFLRFYKLDWGSPYFFHPDERNIAGAVSALHFPNEFNPHFFAYGSFPIYLVYGLGVLVNLTNQSIDIWKVEFTQAILIGRFLSALLSTLIIPLVYVLMLRILEKENRKAQIFALAAAGLTTFTPGFIQYAHFSTFETFLTIEYLLILYLSFQLFQKGRWQDYLLTAILIGLAAATKIVSLILVAVLLITHFLKNFKQQFPNQLRFLTYDLFKIATAIIVMIIIALIASPFNLLDYAGFTSSMRYESAVALGTLPVFYTAGFLKTAPFVYQFFHVFPYILGWPLTMAGLVSLFYLAAYLARQLIIEPKDFKGLSLISLLLAVALLYLIPQGLMFVKWIRYMVPVLPLIVIMIVVTVSHIIQSTFVTRYALLAPLLITLFIVPTILLGVSFFSIYTQPDTRIQAAEWAKNNLPANAKILSEVYDLGITPFNTYFDISNIKLFNFYDLDGSHGNLNPTVPESLQGQKVQELSKLLAWTDYIVLPSPRIYANRLRQPELFPLGSKFYSRLFNQELGFGEIKRFEIDTPFFGDDPEETFVVFDHPLVMIFQKRVIRSEVEYLDLIEKE